MSHSVLFYTNIAGMNLVVKIIKHRLSVRCQTKNLQRS